MSEWIKKNSNMVIFGMLFIVTAYPLISPLGLPIKIDQSTRTFYDLVESLEPGDAILFDVAFGPGPWPECGPQVIATLTHLIRNQVKIVMISGSADGPQMYNKIVQQMGQKLQDLEYGVDFVYLGYLAGTETMQASFADDTSSVVTSDYFGTPLSSLPLMNEVKSGSDIKHAYVSSASGDVGYGWVRQLYERYGTYIILLPTSILITGALPYLDAGQFKALLYGSRGAAQYEVMLNAPGEAVIITDALTLQHIYLIILVVIGNVMYFQERRK